MTLKCSVDDDEGRCKKDATNAVHLPESWFPMCRHHATDFADDPMSEVQAVRPIPQETA